MDAVRVMPRGNGLYERMLDLLRTEKVTGDDSFEDRLRHRYAFLLPRQT
jgi:hypothetical protein